MTSAISVGSPRRCMDVYELLVAGGVPVRSDREKAWRDFAGWRVNYDTVLLQLAALVFAPEARWVSDRGVPTPKPKIFRRSTRAA